LILLKKRSLNLITKFEQISLAIKDSYKRLLEPAISNEALQEAKEKADKKAIEIFSENPGSAAFGSASG
jgi:transcriptional accessory protein Tex/SPT6